MLDLNDAKIKQGVDDFCGVIVLNYPDEKEQIKRKVMAFLNGPEINQEAFLKLLNGNFSVGKAETGEIIITSSRFVCCSEIPRYKIIIGNEIAIEACT